VCCPMGGGQVVDEGRTGMVEMASLVGLFR